VSGMLGQTHHRRQSAGGPGRINTNATSRHRHDGVRDALEPIRSGVEVAVRLERDLEAEAQRPVRLQVVAGPCNQAKRRIAITLLILSWFLVPFCSHALLAVRRARARPGAHHR
jgi:hypothetical protein